MNRTTTVACWVNSSVWRPTLLRGTRRLGGTTPEQPLDEMSDLVVVPDHQNLAGVEDRAVRPADDADQHGENEEADRLAGEQEDRQQGQYHREGGVDRPHEGLQDAVVDDDVERLPGPPRRVLAYSVEDDDRVVHGEADDRQHGRHEWRIDLDVEEGAQNREDAEHDEDVVQHGGEGGHAETDRMWRVTEGEADVEQDDDRRGDDGDERLLRQRLTDGAAHRRFGDQALTARPAPRHRVLHGVQLVWIQ